MKQILDEYHKMFLENIEYRASLIVMRFINKLGLAMEERNISQAELAKKLKISESAVSQFLYYDTNKNPTIETLLKYAEAIGCTLEMDLAEPGANVNEYSNEKKEKNKYNVVYNAEDQKNNISTTLKLAA